MRFVWDEKKNRENIRKHGIDFQDVLDLFTRSMLLNSARKATRNEAERFYKEVAD